MSWRRVRRSLVLAPFFYPYYRWKRWREIRRHTISPDTFLDRAEGIIHVGGHNGGEILDYAKRKLRVLWVEANPLIFPKLLANLRGVPRQHALLGLVGGENRKAREFFLASNDGASSSVFPFGLHESLWPEIRVNQKIILPQFTLSQLLCRAGLSFKGYDTLVLDVQGAELDVLRGISDLAQAFPKIQLEAANFPMYQGAPVLKEIETFLFEKGYRSVNRRVFASDPYGRECMDCRYEIRRFLQPADE